MHSTLLPLIRSAVLHYPFALKSGAANTAPVPTAMPVTNPIPQNLVHHIQFGQFVVIRDVLTDNITLLNQLSSFHSTLNLPLGTLNHAQLREVPSLFFWLYCFNTYVAVRTSDEHTQQMVTYLRLLIREAFRPGDPDGWNMTEFFSARCQSTLHYAGIL